MDRLICGDVGYGKTEVALRAAFKSAQDGKQVMVLVPTTILAQQHYGTFSRAAQGLPGADRARLALPPGRRAEGGDRGASRRGEVDILIGTHRLLSRDVRAKDLGLLIVDEEQRFGVKQKELLQADEAAGRRDRDERHADPAHAADVAGRDPRHQRDRDRARGPAAGQDLRRRVRRGAGQGGAAAREGARRAGVLPAQPRRVDRRDGRAAARAGAADALRGRPRADGGRRARAADARVPARRRRRAGRDLDHRVGDRHPAGQHADRRARRHVRALAALPDPWARRALAASAPTRTCCTRRRRR